MHQLPGVDVELACSPEFEYLQTCEYSTWPHLDSISSSNLFMRKAKFLRSQFTSPRKLMARAEETSADIVHFSNINHLSYASWRTRALKGSFAMTATAHDVRRGKAILNRSWETRWLKQFYRDCRALFVHSEVQKLDLVEFASVNADTVHVVPHGLYCYPPASANAEELRMRYGVPSERPVGLFFGAIRDDKNLDNLLLAIRRSQSRPFLVIAGRPDGKSGTSSLRARIAALQLGDDTLLLDRFIDENEVGDLFELSNFAALTYRTSFTSQSGVLNVAAHYECPVLTTPAPTLSETVTRYGVGVVCGGDDPSAIAAGIDEISVACSRQRAFALYRDEHSWSANAALTVSIVRECRKLSCVSEI